MRVSIVPLGAGQEVGRSCILVSFGDERRVLLDCGIHMGYQDNRKYPDFGFLLQYYQKQSLNEVVDCALVSHFHLDHCAALPVLTEDFGFSGPVFASEPTKAIIPYMLDDFMKVSSDSVYTYTKEKVANCCSKIKVIFLNQTVVCKDIEITTYYAGHVLGAVMFAMTYKNKRVVYTGDFNSSADRHLGACQIDRLQPDVLISEGTYATVNRDWKKERETKFAESVKQTFDRGGKVLIPVFALGRAQEIFALVEDLWEKCEWSVPVYFSAGLTEKVRFFYKVFVNWTNHNIKQQLLTQQKSVFDLRHIQKFEKPYSRLDHPMLLIATPGMLHAGTSLEIFKDLCEDPRNLLLIPGYCVPGTIGNRLLAGDKEVFIDGKLYKVQMEVSKMSFSAHADNAGILNLVTHLSPRNLVFVHGEKNRIETLQKHVEKTLKIPTFCPANFSDLVISIDSPNQTFYKMVGDEPAEGASLDGCDCIAQVKEDKMRVIRKLEKGDVVLRPD